MSAAGLAVRTAPAEPPWRRFGLAETIRDGAGNKIHARVNFDPRRGQVIEVFARTRTPAGSERDVALDDGAIMASKLLQEGVKLETLALATAPGGGIHAVLTWALLIQAELAPC